MKVNKAIRSHVSFLIRSSRVEQCYKNKSDTFLRFQLQACALKYLFIVETSSMKTTILSLSNLQEPEESVRPKNSCTGALFYILNTTSCYHFKSSQVKLSFIVIPLHVWTYSGTRCRASQDHGAT